MQYLPIQHESLELKTEPLEHLGYLLLDIVLRTNRGKEKTFWVEEDWEADKLSSLDLTDSIWGMPKGTARFKNVSICWTTNISFYSGTSGGQKSNLYLNVVHFFQQQC